MVVRLKIILEQEEYSALINSAVLELRDPPSQARFIIRKELEHSGYLKPESDTPKTNNDAISIHEQVNATAR